MHLARKIDEMFGISHSRATAPAFFLESVVTSTTIHLPDDLKARIEAVARRADRTSHSLIPEAIAEKVEARKRRSELHGLAEKRFAAMAASVKAIPWSEMRTDLNAQVAGQRPRRPGSSRASRVAH